MLGGINMYVLQYDLNQVDVDEINNIVKVLKEHYSLKDLLVMPDFLSLRQFSIEELYEIEHILHCYIQEKVKEIEGS